MIPADLLTPPTLIIASVVLVSVLAWMLPSLRSALILEPYRVRTKGEVHRLLTAGWLHGDGAHLFFNMLTFNFFASLPLKVLGPAMFVAFYVGAVVVGFIPTTLRHMKDRRYASIGASGAVSAVMFGAILLQPGMRLHLLFIPIAIPGFVFALGYLAYSAWLGRGARDGVNHDAHFAGAVFGAAFMYVAAQEQVTRGLKALFQ